MSVKNKKSWITDLVKVAGEIGSANPWALALVGYDALRIEFEGKLQTSGDQWYAAHKDDPYGMLDTLAVPDDFDLKRFLKDLMDHFHETGGADLYVIATSQLSDVIKFLVSNPKYRTNLLDMDDEDPWNMPGIGFEAMTVETSNQFLSNRPIHVVFEYRDPDTSAVIHQITLNEKDFWYFTDEQQMKIADRRW